MNFLRRSLFCNIAMNNKYVTHCGLVTPYAAVQLVDWHLKGKITLLCFAKQGASESTEFDNTSSFIISTYYVIGKFLMCVQFTEIIIDGKIIECNTRWVYHYTGKLSWWRHQMETFSAFLALCARNSPVTGEFPAQRPVTRSFASFFDLRLNKQLSKQPWGWWFETPPWPL